MPTRSDNVAIVNEGPRTAAGLALLVSIGGVVHYLLGADACHACGSSSTLLPGYILAGIGGMLYCGAILLLAYSRTEAMGALLVAGSAGVHAVLLKALWDSGSPCSGCITAAVGVGVACVFVTRMKTMHWCYLWMVSLFGLIAGLLAITLIGGMYALDELTPTSSEFREIVDLARHRCTPEAGAACILVVEKEGCAACSIVREPAEIRELERRAGLKLTITRILGNDTSNAPVVVVMTTHKTTVFRGGPSTDQIVDALRFK